MSFLEVLSLFRGVAMFLFGMTLMGNGLKKVSGNKLEPILFRLSGTPLRAILLGTGVTAVIQSSSATSVMTVGFVNSGMMKVRQAIYVILGAILGTSITGWVICLSYLEGGGSLSSILSTNTLVSIVAITGILFRMIGKDSTRQHIGDILMGFAVLMVGMHTMSDSVSGLREMPWFMSAMSSMRHPLLGIIVGALFAAILQSASAAVGILQALSATGALTFEAVLPLLMGITIGAALPVLLSAIGADTQGKRAAAIYPIVSIAEVLGCAVLFYSANGIFGFPFISEVMNPFSTAFVNTKKLRCTWKNASLNIHLLPLSRAGLPLSAWRYRHRKQYPLPPVFSRDIPMKACTGFRVWKTLLINMKTSSEPIFCS